MEDCSSIQFTLTECFCNRWRRYGFFCNNADFSLSDMTDYFHKLFEGHCGYARNESVHISWKLTLLVNVHAIQLMWRAHKELQLYHHHKEVLEHKSESSVELSEMCLKLPNQVKLRSGYHKRKVSHSNLLGWSFRIYSPLQHCWNSNANSLVFDQNVAM